MKNSTVKRPRRAWVSVLAGALILMLGPDFTSAQNGAAARAGLTWRVVVNNGVTVPGDTRRFNSYNEPSLNVYGLVVFRARSKGGTSGEPAHGVFTRDMAVEGAISTIFDRNTLVPEPNNLGTLFAEPPSFPRIDMWSDTVASRGNHAPARAYLLPDQSETRAWTNGIYTRPFSSLITGATNVGNAPGLEFFAVPGTNLTLRFEVFPGAPSPTSGATIVFKGNHSAPDPNNPAATISKTGVYSPRGTRGGGGAERRAGARNERVGIRDQDRWRSAAGRRVPQVTVGCTTAKPGPTWVCVNGGWLPPDHPLAAGTPPSLPPSGGGCTTVQPGPAWMCIKGAWLPPDHPLVGGTPPSPPPAGGACTTAQPGPVWVCVNGGWVPPDHPLARGGG